MAIISAGSATPPGTPPQPVRRSTKHKQPAYGQHLMAKHAEKVARKKARKAAELAATAKAQADAATAKAKRK